MEIQARKMKKRFEEEELCRVGQVIQFRLSEYDRTKVDYHNLTAMIVDVKRHTRRGGQDMPLKNPKYRVATKKGYLDKWLDAPSFRTVMLLTASPMMADLDGVVDMYLDKLLHPTTIRKMARLHSLVPGGQGMKKCGCRGECSESRRCKCFRNNMFCTSRCHPRNIKCKNC